MLEYADGDKLYVPVASLNLIHRYTGAESEAAPLHSLGSERWSKARARAKERAADVAAELLQVQARRAAKAGTPMAVDEADYSLFCEGFPFQPTIDQQKAIDAVLADLAGSKPMDRVVCGDVGFGKTEVALRACFAAARAGKQVCVLAPTTLLVQQHEKNFRDRFAQYDTGPAGAGRPFRIAALSRLRTAKEQAAMLEELRDGKIDIVIGTHRLLQDDVRFKDLGLVVVDEEHRFGVRHKERLKNLRAEVHLLTLTATPIPRTLNMSLAGLRDMSIIATPPASRLAIRTFVAEWDNALVYEACLRELRRGGQIYVLHNEVRSIERFAADLQKLVPEGRVRFAHGQMRERELEQVMLDFYHGRFNILVCTTIIESGIDVPTANTILIYRADHLGYLAQPCTNCAGASAAAITAHTPTCWCRANVPCRPTPRSAWRRSRNWANSAPASCWPHTTWKSAAPASCWARTSPARSRKSASPCMPSCWLMRYARYAPAASTTRRSARPPAKWISACPR